MKLIVAGSFEQFTDYCRENSMKPQKDAIYVHHYDQFLDRNGGTELILYGDYYKNPVWASDETRLWMLTYGKDHKWVMPEDY